MAKVSILMAVYNAERWLAESIGSLQRQTFADWQLICVDDASTDASLSVLNDWARQDARIVVTALPENSGQAHARNVGLQQATGEYVCFLDADDWLSDDALEQAVAVFERNEQTDCVLFRVMLSEDGQTREYSMPSFDKLPGAVAFDMSLDWTIHGVYMVRAVLFHRFPYDETCRSYSDDNTTRLHFANAREVRTCGGAYFYRQHPDSVTHRLSVRRFDILRANESMKRQLCQLGVEAAMLTRYENTRWLWLIDCCMFYHVHGRQLTKEERHYGLSELHRVWSTIDRSLLNKKTTAKFGYRPCLSWRLFRLQEWLYFTLRGFLGKNH